MANEVFQNISTTRVANLSGREIVNLTPYVHGEIEAILYIDSLDGNSPMLRNLFHRFDDRQKNVYLGILNVQTRTWPHLVYRMFQLSTERFAERTAVPVGLQRITFEEFLGLIREQLCTDEPLESIQNIGRRLKTYRGINMFSSNASILEELYNEYDRDESDGRDFSSDLQELITQIRSIFSGDDQLNQVQIARIIHPINELHRSLGLYHKPFWLLLFREVVQRIDQITLENYWRLTPKIRYRHYGLLEKVLVKGQNDICIPEGVHVTCDELRYLSDAVDLISPEEVCRLYPVKNVEDEEDRLDYYDDDTEPVCKLLEKIPDGKINNFSRDYVLWLTGFNSYISTITVVATLCRKGYSFDWVSEVEVNDGNRDAMHTILCSLPFGRIHRTQWEQAYRNRDKMVIAAITFCEGFELSELPLDNEGVQQLISLGPESPEWEPNPPEWDIGLNLAQAGYDFLFLKEVSLSDKYNSGVSGVLHGSPFGELHKWFWDREVEGSTDGWCRVIIDHQDFNLDKMRISKFVEMRISKFVETLSEDEAQKHLPVIYEKVNFPPNLISTELLATALPKIAEVCNNPLEWKAWCLSQNWVEYAECFVVEST
ncbi:MAG: hypothetical protein P0S94_05650 [Simkaniaceae bacterium]|nr:hypothetical protein [Simkaniaceae bacterium]